MIDVFLKLLNMSITASYLVLAICVLRLIWRKAPKWFFCFLWCLVGLRLVCPISVQSPWSLIPDAEPVAVEWLEEQDIVAKGQVSEEDISNAQAVDQEVIVGAGMSSEALYASSTNEAMEAPGAYSGHNTSKSSIYVFVTVLWLLGIVALLSYTVVTYLRLKLRIQDAVHLQDNIYQSEKVESPFVLGIVSPRIYLPFKIDDESRSCVIAHEKAHIKRGDHFSKPMGFLLLMVYWFNPFIWLAYILFCRDIELACDERVMKDMDIEKRKVYSTVLLNLSISHRSIAACPLAFGEVGIATRIRNALSYTKPTKWIVALCVVLGVIVVVCFLTNPGTKESEGTSQAINQEGFGENPSESKEGSGENAPENQGTTSSVTGRYLAANGGIYMYCFRMSGTLPNMQKPLTFTVYTNNSDITFEQVAQHYFGIPADMEQDMYVYCPDFVPVEQEADVLDEKEVLVSEEKIFDFVIVRGSTGEELTAGVFDFSSLFQDLNKMYTDLKFEEVSEQEPRAGYAYSLRLYDVKGNLLQTVTPYTDGVDIDGVFYDCGLNQTGKRLFTYLDLLFTLQEEEETGRSVVTDMVKESGDCAGTGLIIGEKFEGEIDTIDGVELSITEFNENISLHVSNETDKEVLFGSSYSIQIEANDEWYYLELMDGSVVFPDEGYYAPAEVTVNYRDIYGIFPPRNFRVVKSVSVYDNGTQYTKYLIATEELHVINYRAEE